MEKSLAIISSDMENPPSLEEAEDSKEPKVRRKKKKSAPLPPLKTFTIQENEEIDLQHPKHSDEEKPLKRLKKKKKKTLEEDSKEVGRGGRNSSRKKDSILNKFGRRSTSIESRRSDSGVIGKQLRTQTSRYEDRFRNEDKSTEEAFIRHIEKHKDEFERKRSGTPRVSRDDAYDFFTKIIPQEESLHLPSSINEDPANDLEEDKSTDDAESSKVMVRDILGDKFGQAETVLTSPEKRQPAPDLQSCGLYIPLTHKVPLESKLDENKEPFFPEEDGIYIGTRPVTVSRNQNKLETRIIAEKKGSLWFGPDGKLISNYESIQVRSCRPPVVEDWDTTPTFYARPQSPTSFYPPFKQKQGSPACFNCQLDIDVSSVVFIHHHLFSIEHFLTKEITKFYEDYQRNLAKRSEAAYERKLEVLYATLDQIRDETQTEESDNNVLEFKERRIKTYKLEVASIRQSRDSTEATERELIKTILTLWKNLRDFRKKQAYSLTNHRIIIHKEKPSDPDEELRRWSAEIQRQVEDLHSEFLAKKKEQEIEFDVKMSEWKTMHANRREALKRQKQREKDSSEGFGSAELADIAADERLLSLPELEKPRPLHDFDRSSVMKSVEDNALRCRKPPGESRLYLELTWNSSGGSTATIGKENGVHDNREKSRRAAISKTKLWVKVFINGKEACHSSPASLSQDFTCQIGRIFPIQILQWPETIKLKIYEGTLLKSMLLADVSIPLCEPSVTLDSSQVEAIHFKSDSTISHDHLGLGSSVDFSINTDGSEIVSRKTNGIIHVRVGWGKSPSTGEALCPPSSLWKPSRPFRESAPVLDILNPEGLIDNTKLDNWMIKSRIDPNDPSNAELMKRIAETALENKKNPSYSVVCEETPTGGNNYFRLDQHLDQFTFTTMEDIESNPRFKLLLLRKAKVSEFKNYKMIPVSEKEIPRGILEAREKKAAATRKDVIGSGNPLRSRSRLYLNRLRAQVSHRFSLVKHRKSHMDIVVEDPIPDSKFLLHMFGEMMPAQRPLRPVRMERQKVLIHDLSGQDIRLSLTIVRAFDVPVRVATDSIQSSVSLKGNPGGSREIVRENRVNSYIEARFQSESARTHSSPGPNPAWNQQLSLAFKSKNNDYSTVALYKVSESLHLHLFDEILIDMSTDTGIQGDNNQIYQRLERKWLGSLSIPFSSIYKNTRIEGTFRLYSPPIVLGYERVNSIAGLPEATNNGDGREATYLNVYITIEPALIVPDQSIKEKLDSDEQDEVVEHCRKWSMEIHRSFPNRKVNPFVIDVSGKSILMSRYIHRIDPPEEVINGEVSGEKADQVAWFVSLIPYLPSNALFPGLKNIWPTSLQFISMMVGSESEHAVLLANYFIALKKRVFLVLGQGIPEGPTTYVLTVESESGERVLWNPISAERFRVSESFCPLKAVFALVDEGNIWANVQNVVVPSRLKWDLSSGSDWCPLFDRSFSNTRLPSVQLDSIAYTPSDPRAAKILKDKLERALRDSLMNLRPKLRTSLNFHGNAVLRKLLPGLESTRGGTSRDRRSFYSEHLSGLQQIGASHKICGFPLHFAFTEIEDVIKGLKSTGVQHNQDPNVEFALAVDVKPYPNTVMSVWVYIASLIKRS